MSFSHNINPNKTISFGKDLEEDQLQQAHKEKQLQEWSSKRCQSIVASMISEEEEFEKNPQLYEVIEIDLQFLLKKSSIQELTEEETIELEKKKDEQRFMKFPLGFLSYLKGKHILKEILDPIQHQKLLNLEDPQFVQFLFLVSTRCYNYFSVARAVFEKGKQPQISEYLDEVYAFELKAQSKFKGYLQLLKEDKQRLGKKLVSFSEIFTISEKNKQKYRFMNGFEGVDYSVKQQIEYTFNKYMEKVLNSEEISSQYFVNHRLKKCLRAYKKICSINEKQTHSKQEFEILREQILLDQ